jgi:hypothetical protein
MEYWNYGMMGQQKGIMEWWNIGWIEQETAIDLFSFSCLSLLPLFQSSNIDEFVISLLSRHPGESRGPELVEFTGFRRSPE